MQKAGAEAEEGQRCTMDQMSLMIVGGHHRRPLALIHSCKVTVPKFHHGNQWVTVACRKVVSEQPLIFGVVPPTVILEVNHGGGAEDFLRNPGVVVLLTCLTKHPEIRMEWGKHNLEWVQIYLFRHRIIIHHPHFKVCFSIVPLPSCIFLPSFSFTDINCSFVSFSFFFLRSNTMQAIGTFPKIHLLRQEAMQHKKKAGIYKQAVHTCTYMN